MGSQSFMPGGAIATTAQAVQLRGSRGTARRTKRRRTKRTGAARAQKRAKRSNGGRKLKFGSPAWRKKFMKKRR